MHARTPRAPLCVIAAVLTAVLAPTPASAHTPTLKAACADGQAVLSVELRNYNDDRPNRLHVTDGATTLDSRTFGSHLRRAYTRDGTAAHTFTVTVEAWDDRYWSRGWSFTRSLPIPPCATLTPPPPPPPPTTTTTPPPAPTTTVPTTTTTTATTTTTTALTLDWPTTRPKPAVIPAATGLPDTGADVTAPLVIGLLLLTGGTAVLILLRRRANS
ncbi:LPXTG cell wall anchor domain-containing protein [Saccharothrix sp. NPDC042600]|uniref:LPXTG cell wall anchor domain-containing protein n=1 Tax=Saccharothrix TaxID=2071 RepID=UPI0033D4B885|nr:hypothetical protein GCM10017745_29260 [Saccharothrix mutabilis subsp. capreolus]